MLALAALVVVALGSASVAQVRVMPGDVKDTRRTDGFFNKLEVELKVLGDVLAQAKGIRYTVEKAVDETGKNLINEEKTGSDFEEISNPDSVKIELELKNPSRQAMTVKEISGTLEIFAPQRDPASSVTVPSFVKQTGKMIANPALKAAGLEVTIWTKEQFEANKKAEEEKLKKAMEERRKKGAKEGEDIADALAEGLAKMFGGMFGAFGQMGENSVAFQVNDPNARLISIEFETAQGKSIERNGRMTMGDQPKTMIYEFDEKLPATARLKVYLITPKSLVKVPFKLTDVPLP
jgi:hypothetical protein